jgi:uncharacterized damage-inducible protein DinB
MLDMKNQALKLISYDHWANEKIITAMSQVENLPPGTTELLSHILAVSSIWLSRTKGEKETANRFDLYAFEECDELNRRMQSNWIAYIKSLEEVEKIMRFKLLGQQSQMTVSDCINHVVVHGSYHRGQIVALLKGQMPELPTTDFVLFARSESR